MFSIFCSNNNLFLVKEDGAVSESLLQSISKLLEMMSSWRTKSRILPYIGSTDHYTALY